MTKTMQLTTAAGLAVLLVAGCGTGKSGPAPAAPGATAPATAAATPHTEVALYVAGMSERLELLWGDWPNRVKQALAGLDGVESVEDEWDRQLEADEPLDLLYVTYQPDRLDVDQLLETVRAEGFEARLQSEEDSAGE